MATSTWMKTMPLSRQNPTRRWSSMRTPRKAVRSTLWNSDTPMISQERTRTWSGLNQETDSSRTTRRRNLACTQHDPSTHLSASLSRCEASTLTINQACLLDAFYHLLTSICRVASSFCQVKEEVSAGTRAIWWRPYRLLVSRTAASLSY